MYLALARELLGMCQGHARSTGRNTASPPRDCGRTLHGHLEKGSGWAIPDAVSSIERMIRRSPRNNLRCDCYMTLTAFEREAGSPPGRLVPTNMRVSKNNFMIHYSRVDIR
jgi:hypothetical protein